MGNIVRSNKSSDKEERRREEIEEMVNMFADQLIDLLWQQAQLNLKKRGEIGRENKKSQKDLP